MIDVVYSVCSKEDIDVWRYASSQILNHISAKQYMVIVPEEQTETFKNNSGEEYTVTGENKYITRQHRRSLKQKITSQDNESRFHWYLQQFIKLSALEDLARNSEKIVIWDADTVPLQNIDFFNSEGEPVHFIGNKHHEPYFELIDTILGMSKEVEFSFIAQNFPITSQIVQEFFNHVESCNSESWFKSFVRNIDFSQGAGFSEYETLGTFINNRYSHLPKLQTDPSASWVRNGYRASYSATIPTAIENLRSNYEYAAFEKYQKPSTIKNQVYKILRTYHKIH